MNLAQRLAENILRFNAKNLDNSAISNIGHRIVEQATTTNSVPKSIEELKDSQQVMSAPGYADIMGKLIKLANKPDGKTEKLGLQYWMGSVGSNKFVKMTDTVINAYNILTTKFNESELKTDPTKATSGTAKNFLAMLAKLGELVKLLQDNKQNNVYIDVQSNLKTAYTYLQQCVAQSKNLKIVARTFDMQSCVADLINPQLSSMKELNKLVTNFSALKNGDEAVAKTSVASITDADKIELLAAAQQQIAKHQEKKKIGGGLAFVDSIVIAADTQFDSVVRTVTPVPNADGTIPIVTAYTIPDISSGNNAEAQNFLGDNVARPSAEQKKRFAEVLQTAINKFNEQKIKITKIGYNAGATTSQVWTRYNGDGQPLAAASSREANEKLVADRIQFINETLRAVISENPAVNKLEITELTNDGQANIGPVYGKDAQGAFGPKDIRWKFVKDASGNYVIDPKQKALYESTYASSRMSFGAFTLFGTATPPVEPDETVSYTGTGKWRIKLIWKTIDIPPLVPPSGGRVAEYPTKGNGVACPINL